VKKLGLWKKILIATLLLLLLAILLFLAWASNTSNADAKKLSEFLDQNANSVEVKEYPGYWEIRPKTDECSDEDCLKTLAAGLIFYPGARIDPQAYFYKLDFLANGKPFKLKLFISKPPLHLAFFGINQADEIIKQNPGVSNWMIGGHSLGGAMACQYAGSHPEKITELFLLGAYCGSSVRGTSLKVISLHGSEDGVITLQKLADNDKNLPDSRKDFMITGMNHAQAGNYGDQAGDKAATKTDEDVKMEIVAILKDAL
jgi:hypothetical protein